ncbi:MAG TPA: ribosome small subunit-dependent GTPase A [Phycisphaerae bacterium]|jgi:ribosome biogenesis GTPase
MRRKRNAPARAKHWTRQVRDQGAESVETRHAERVVPRGDLSRMRTVVVKTPDADAPLMEGRVIAMRGLIAEVDDGQHIWPCTVRRMLRTRLIAERHPVTVGDVVQFSPAIEQAERSGAIESVRPRRSVLTRTVGHRLHVIAANIDQALIVNAADAPRPKPHLIDRYIVAALHGGLVPIICLNKIDLDADGRGRELLRRYQRLGYATLACSTVTRDGLEALRTVLAGKSSVLAGQSGVGKSSLLNAIEPGLRLKVADIVAHLGKGRHTTTTAQLLPLELGGYVVDTPGIRTLDLSGVPRHEIEKYFVEFIERIPQCKFPNCTHTHETGCAVKAALTAGEIHPERYESYVRMFADPGGP